MIAEKETFYKMTKEEFTDLIKDTISKVASEAADEALLRHLTEYRLFSKKDAAKQLGISPATMTKWCSQGKVKTTNGFISGYELSKLLGKLPTT